MKKHCLKKTLALNALMAFVITGSAYAADFTVNAGEERSDVAEINVDTGKFKNEGTVIADTSITVNGGTFTNTSTGTINTGILNIYGNGTDQSEIAGNITADTFTYRGIAGALYTRGLSAALTTDELHIIGTNNQTGLKVLNKNVLDNVGKIVVESSNAKTGLVIGKGLDINIKAPIYLNCTGSKEDARVEVEGGARVTINEIHAQEGKTRLQLNNTASAAINNITVESGKFNLQTLGDKDNNDIAEFNLNQITIADNAQFRTSVYQEDKTNKINSPAHITGDNVTINLGKNAKADFGGVGDEAKDWRGEQINFDVDKLTINMTGANTDEYNYTNKEDYKSDYNHGVYIHVNSDWKRGDPIDCSYITVVGGATNNTGDLKNDLQRLAYVVKITHELGDYKNYADNEIPEILYPAGAHVEQTPGGIDDGGEGTVNDDGDVIIDKTIKNPDVFGTGEVGALGLISWRSDLDDMNKRLGELRDSTGEHGIWVRMIRGESDYKSLNHQYNTYQIGYDKKLSNDPRWTMGAALSYTDGKGGYHTGSYEMDHKTFTIYGSKLNDNGSYIDIVGKYSRLNHDLRNTWGNGEYDANAYSLGIEVGKRFQQSKGFWIEPQVQLTYGHVTGDTYRAGDIEVAQDGMNSLIGRAGFRIGKDWDSGNVYLRASYLYDFDGETGVTFTNAEGRTRSFDEDLGGGWYEVGVGTNINISESTHLYFDFEKTFGGEIITDWKWNAGVRYSF